MKILLVGKGGREHALAWRLRQDDPGARILCPNANPGIASIAHSHTVSLEDGKAWADYAVQQRVDLVVIGPEAPLAGGLADLLRELRIPVFGPGAPAARIESSKWFLKQLLREAGIATAKGDFFTEPAPALAYAHHIGFPVVVKADGLAGGKGVIIANGPDVAAAALHACLVEGRFGEAGRRVVVEEFLFGREASAFALCDGRSIRMLPFAEDHKQLEEGDCGPNTGGMGSMAPAPFVTPEISAQVERAIMVPLVQALRAREIDYRGVLYAGLMLTAAGPRVLEFNARFGDPEAQVLMPLIAGDFTAALLACANGDLGQAPRLGQSPGTAVGIVAASAGYPGDFTTGHVIEGLDRLPPDILVFHAGTKRHESGTIVTAGGRVFSLVARGADPEAARHHALEAMQRVKFPGMHYRRDIGCRTTRQSR